jgi:hypothetical protein
MPQPPLSPQERRLAIFCRLSAAIYFLAALAFVATPWLGDATPSTGVLAAALTTSIATACLVAAGRPRERRHALLPVLTALFTATVLALFHAETRGHVALVAVGAGLFVATLFVYRSSAPGVHSEPAREGPPPDAPPPQQKIQLGIKSS